MRPCLAPVTFREGGREAGGIEGRECSAEEEVREEGRQRDARLSAVRGIEEADVREVVCASPA